MDICSDPVQVITLSAKQFFAENNLPIELQQIIIQRTKEEIPGEYTLVLFPILKFCKIADLGNKLGTYILKHNPQVFVSFRVIQGFLNFSLADTWLSSKLNYFLKRKQYIAPKLAQSVIIEYSSPNTNKPLHLGHLRNIFLGYAMCKLAIYNGYTLNSTCVVNDRGIHICKSMLAWKLWGEGRSPETENQKGDHFVGDYYVRFAKELKHEIEENNILEKDSTLLQKTQEMLCKWEKGDVEVRALWKQMNNWVYQGFNETYEKLGISFDKIYYESETYLLGKQLVEHALSMGICVRKPDNSIWIRLSEQDEKLLLRSDGTSVYITQDIGLALQKYQDFQADNSIYIVGDEQQYHFQTLKKILQCFKFLPQDAANIQHLSYGMVELTSGKMKSREGMVVDADDLITKMQEIAISLSEELGRGSVQEDMQLNISKIALAALKFFLLRIDPKKKIVFDPNESIDFQGFTGPFIQYTHARICSLLSKSIYKQNDLYELNFSLTEPLLSLERILIFEFYAIDSVIFESYHKANPSFLAQYIYNLARCFNLLYANHSFLRAESGEKQLLRMCIALITKNILQVGADILGLELPEKM